MNDKTNIEQLIARYLNGEYNSSDHEMLKSWLEDSNQNRKLFYQIKDAWDASLKKEDNTRDALMKFYKNQASKNNASKKIIFLWKTVASIAAVFAIVLSSLFLLNISSNQKINIETKEVSFKVPFGSRSEVNLPDGTVVMLNSGSELKYPGIFTDENRKVSLSGEAFFKVKSDKKNPFIVEISHLNVEVTGTQFNICSYADDDFSKISLLEGRVGIRLGENNEIVDINPGQQFYLDKEQKKYEITESDVTLESSWKDGEFRFKEIAFPELIKRLERWYNIDLTFSIAELGKMSYSGNFKNQETIWQVLDALKLTSPIDYKKTGYRKFEIIYKPKKE